MTKEEYNKREYEIESLDCESNINAIASILDLKNGDEIANAVFKQMGYSEQDLKNTREILDLADTLSNISNHGIDGGFNGFISYAETSKFFDENKNAILDSICNEAQEIGYANELEMINGFRCNQNENFTLNDFRYAEKTQEELYEVADNNPDFDKFRVERLKNSLSWYAGERIAHNLVNLKECPDCISKESKNLAENKINNCIKRELGELKKEFEKSNNNSLGR